MDRRPGPCIVSLKRLSGEAGWLVQETPTAGTRRRPMLRPIAYGLASYFARSARPAREDAKATHLAMALSRNTRWRLWPMRPPRPAAQRRRRSPATPDVLTLGSNGYETAVKWKERLLVWLGPAVLAAGFGEAEFWNQSPRADMLPQPRRRAHRSPRLSRKNTQWVPRRHFKVRHDRSHQNRA